MKAQKHSATNMSMTKTMVLLGILSLANFVIAVTMTSSQKTPLGIQQVTARNFPVRACHKSSGGINVAAGLPRTNRELSALPKNLGRDMKPMLTVGESCSDTAEETDFCFNPEFALLLETDDFTGVIQNGDHTEIEGDWTNYIDALVIWAVIGFLFSIFTFLFSFCFCFARCCCGYCGGRKSLRGKDRDELDEYGGDEDDDDEDNRVPEWQIITTYTTLVLFIIFMFSWILAGSLNGNVGITDAQKSFVRSPDGVVAFSKGLPQPIEVTFTSFAGNTLANLIDRTRDYLDDVIDFDNIHINFGCLENSLDRAKNNELFPYLLNAIAEMREAVNEIPDPDDVNEVLRGFTNETRKLEPPVLDLLGFLDEFKASIGNISVDELNATVANLDGALTNLTENLGDVRSIILSYVAVQGNVTAAEASLVTLLAEPYTEDSISDANNSLLDLQQSTQELPEEDQVADSLTDLDINLDNTLARLDELIEGLNDTQKSFDRSPDVIAVNATINEILGILDGISFNNVLNTTGSVDNVLSKIPRSEAVNAQINKFLQIRVDLDPCLGQLTDVFDRVNESLFELPGSIKDARKEISDLNQTIEDQINELDSVDDFLDELNETVSSLPNSSEFDIVIRDLEKQLKEVEADVLELQSQLDDIDGDSSNFNIQDLIDDVVKTREDLANSDARIDEDEAEQIRNLSSSRNDLVEAVDTLVQLFTEPNFNDALFDNNGDPEESLNCFLTTTTCYDRGASTLNNRYPIDPVEPADDSFEEPIDGCTSPNKCPFPYVQIQESIFALREFNASLSDSPLLEGGVLEGIDDAIASIAEVDTDEFSDFTELRDFQESLDDQSEDAQQLQQDLDDMFELELDDLGDSFSDLNETLTDVRDDLDNVEEQILDANETVFDQISTFDDFVDTEEVVYDVFRNGGDLQAELAKIRAPELEEEINSGNGLAGAVRLVRTFVDNIKSRFDDVDSVSTDDFDTSMLDDFEELFEVLDFARDRDDDVSNVGSIYYIIRLMEKFQDADVGFRRRLLENDASRKLLERFLNAIPGVDLKSTDRLSGMWEQPGLHFLDTKADDKEDDERKLQASPGDGGNDGGDDTGNGIPTISLTDSLGPNEVAEYDFPLVFGYLDGGEIKAYPGEVSCFTNECFDNTIDLFNRRSIPESVLGYDVPVSREQAMVLPFLAPIICLLIGVATLFFPRCGCCLAFCTLCTTIFFFLFVGGLFWPIVLMFSDFCASVEYAGGRGIREAHPALCKTISSDAVINQDAAICTVAFDIPQVGVTWEAELEMEEILLSLTLGCKVGLSSANVPDGEDPMEPVEALWQSLEETAGDIAQEQIDLLLDDGVDTTGLTFRESFTEVFRQSTPDLTGDVKLFANSTGGAISCDSVSEAYLGFKDTLCCDLGGALYWWGASFYLMAFTMLLCGCPAGAYARSRMDKARMKMIVRDKVGAFKEKTGMVEPGQRPERRRPNRAQVAEAGGGTGNPEDLQVATPVDENGEPFLDGGDDFADDGTGEELRAKGKGADGGGKTGKKSRFPKIRLRSNPAGDGTVNPESNEGGSFRNLASKGKQARDRLKESAQGSFRNLAEGAQGGFQSLAEGAQGSFRNLAEKGRQARDRLRERVKGPAQVTGDAGDQSNGED